MLEDSSSRRVVVVGVLVDGGGGVGFCFCFRPSHRLSGHTGYPHMAPGQIGLTEASAVCQWAWNGELLAIAGEL